MRDKSFYRSIGLKCGLEIHQRLKGGKLFCSCRSTLSEEPSLEIIRKLRAVYGELGVVDRAAAFEHMRNRKFVYKYYPSESCLVECDEEPPHQVNKEALEAAITAALMLNAKVVDEIHVMRKTVIDGSNTSGFQRTMVIALDGYLEYKGEKIPIAQVCLEEEACGILEDWGDTVVYRLDRLGIPLVEVSTGLLEGYSPEEIQEIALLIGVTLRSTGKVRRGLGSTRQDLNVSISGGSRVEIKGVQELELISKVVENEVERQLSLIKLAKELKEAGVREEDFKPPMEVTELFSETKNRVIKRALKSGGVVFAAALPGLSGFASRELCPGLTLGKELAYHARAYGVGGIIHSDEDLAKLKLEDEFKKLRELLKAGSRDLIFIVAGPPDRAAEASRAVVERAKQLLNGPPEETRAANPDGTTRFTRPLPGAARMYPETDIPPMPIPREYVESIRASLPEHWEQKVKRFTEQLGLPRDLARQVVWSEYLSLFEEAVEKTRLPPTLIASTLVSTLKDIKRRDKIPVEQLPDEKIMEALLAVDGGKISKEALPDVLRELAKSPGETVQAIAARLGIKPITLEELREIISSTIQDNMEVVLEKRERALGLIMGRVMAKVKGRIDGKVVSEEVKRKLKEVLSTSRVEA
ncbi:MAG: Glu-tRNA(Gln) amidotransferase GatDE subunit E [Thermoproteota archaeon]|nr:MAG: Glu-tRNA(Gln) amidotransferase GatDE subunit E [Candidatus Korarchaeota archaeon]RLG56243.1 MAG: Glu-tRNA(Gln) amidotransferase GatDE subunit E [Candidatus Korarchaeota archaeon]